MTAEDLARIEPEARSLLPEFLKGGRDRHARIDGLVARSEFKELRRLGHGLKGTGAIYGLPEFSAVGLQMEEAAESQNGDAIIALNKQLGVLIEQLAAALDQAGSAP